MLHSFVNIFFYLVISAEFPEMSIHGIINLPVLIFIQTLGYNFTQFSSLKKEKKFERVCVV